MPTHYPERVGMQVPPLFSIKGSRIGRDDSHMAHTPSQTQTLFPHVSYELLGTMANRATRALNRSRTTRATPQAKQAQSVFACELGTNTRLPTQRVSAVLYEEYGAAWKKTWRG
ncbi:hypothetical protein CLCR_05271 [Cladophialophora carrionii]|uniref:Uncharacterized protein n=1 Tax=Cladophialophora carrionii TaxID=86049 RepID=A0A1C1CJE7_9EURO|nr:hypothetical protein CLCR_05271 [Cladophialophora carrionii]